SGDALWRWLTDPHGKSPCQRPADLTTGAVARNFCDADRALGTAPQPDGLRDRRWQPGRLRRHRCRVTRTGGGGDPPAARGLQARATNGQARAGGTRPTGLTDRMLLI